MTHRRNALLIAGGLAQTAVLLVLTLTGCSNETRAPGPAAPGPAAPGASVEVIGRLVALKDDRPVDGGIDLTLETDRGDRELARVPSVFIPPPREQVMALHNVVDAAKVGDRLRARGTRDESGALRVEFLELLPR